MRRSRRKTEGKDKIGWSQLSTGVRDEMSGDLDGVGFVSSSSTSGAEVRLYARRAHRCVVSVPYDCRTVAVTHGLPCR